MSVLELELTEMPRMYRATVQTTVKTCKGMLPNLSSDYDSAECFPIQPHIMNVRLSMKSRPMFLCFSSISPVSPLSISLPQSIYLSPSHLSYNYTHVD